MTNHDPGDEDRKPLNVGILDVLILHEELAPKDLRIWQEREIADLVEFQQRTETIEEVA